MIDRIKTLYQHDAITEVTLTYNPVYPCPWILRLNTIDGLFREFGNISMEKAFQAAERNVTNLQEAF
jgi:hypothetical protein